MQFTANSRQMKDATQNPSHVKFTD